MILIYKSNHSFFLQYNFFEGLHSGLPCLKLIVVNTVSIPEDEEVVLLIALAGFVLDVPVVLPRDLVVVPGTQNALASARS